MPRFKDSAARQENARRSAGKASHARAQQQQPDFDWDKAIAMLRAHLGAE